jgi:hypothetical protein
MATADSSSLSACSICRRFAATLGIFSSSGHVTVEEDTKRIPVEDILSSDCTVHVKMLGRIMRRMQRGEQGGKQRGRLGKYQEVGLGKWGGGFAFELGLPSGGFNIQTVELANRTDFPNHPGRGRILDRQWVNMEIVQQWKVMCHENHGIQCHNPLNIAVGEPSWLIDTQLNCLVKGGGHSSYVALSYRWAGASGLQTSLSTLERLQRHGEFESQDILFKIPATVRNAMSLVRSLRERYLWVDALCIVQDDDASKLRDINQMASIYASATITIIAADGDADGGLRGLRGISDPRSLKQQRIHSFYKDKIIEVDLPATVETYIGTEYATRGWTLQEHTMSARRLIFSGGMLHWECSCAVWHEDRIPFTVPSPVRRHIPLDRILRGIPSLVDYDQLAKSFSYRSLTYDQDALHAVSGLLTILSRSFEGGFLYALPEMFFDIALAWDSGSNMRRRGSSHYGNSEERIQLPSWSWIGWQGQVENSHSQDDMNAVEISSFNGYCSPTETFPITEWYASETPHTVARRRIKSQWFDYKNKLRDFSRPPPPGWIRDDYVPSHKSWYPKGCGNYCFTHESIPNTKFWHPIPIFDTTQSTQLAMSQSMPYISCETYRAWFLACPTRMDKDFSIKGRLAVLKNSSGTNVGKLCLNQSKDMGLLGTELFHFGGDEIGSFLRELSYDDECSNGNEFSNKNKPLDEDETLGRIELVAISGSRYTEEDREFKSYHVLWVKWVHGVAYRRGHGMVKWSAWEAQCPEPVTLVLG